jgi:hypothetical protein
MLLEFLEFFSSVQPKLWALADNDHGFFAKLFVLKTGIEEVFPCHYSSKRMKRWMGLECQTNLRFCSKG